MATQFPQPGDLILVEKSEWYALKDGQRLRVCEVPGWITEGEAIYVAPRDRVRSFWGPAFGPPDDADAGAMSTSGGPFKTVPVEELAGLQAIGRELDWFWHWRDWPRAGGGVDYQKEVTVWSLPLLIDQHYRKMAEFRKEVVS
ncbi:MAG: hypothetical protein KF861_20150 [Planctomycetaceae bacterium]|nr:hypothetical protein [Planctomycetaceae bacterium]